MPIAKRDWMVDSGVDARACSRPRR